MNDHGWPAKIRAAFEYDTWPKLANDVAKFAFTMIASAIVVGVCIRIVISAAGIGGCTLF